MRFDLGLLYALAATPIATAVKWNSDAAAAGYQYGAVICAAGALVCNSQGVTVGTYALGSGGFCCSIASATVTAAKSKGIQQAWKTTAEKLGAAAQVTKDGASKVGGFVAECSGKVCKMVRKKKSSPLPRRSMNKRARGSMARRSTKGRRSGTNLRRSIDELERRRWA